MQIEIRKFTDEDVDVIIDIFQQSVRRTASKDYDPGQIAAWSQVDTDRWRTRQSNRPTWIALVKGVPAGFTDLESDGHLDMMFVHPDFAGQGVATSLLRQVEQHAKKLSLSRIFTEASITAKPFFEKNGFTVIAEQVVEIRGAKLRNYRMEKFLVE